MIPSRSRLALVTALALLVVSARAVRAGGFTEILSQVECISGSTTRVSWVMYIDPRDPPDPVPDWVGYDVYRRSTADCGPSVRLNPDIIPKAQAFQTLTWDDSPSSGSAFEYFVDVVDAQRRHVSIGPAFVYTRSWVTCPQLLAPITVGRLWDMGWALNVQPCAESCYPPVFFDDPKRVAELRPYAGTDQVVRFFGGIACCAVEGAIITIDRYEFGACDGPVPAGRTTWGRLKSIYR